MAPETESPVVNADGIEGFSHPGDFCQLNSGGGYRPDGLVEGIGPVDQQAGGSDGGVFQDGEL